MDNWFHTRPSKSPEHDYKLFIFYFSCKIKIFSKQ